MARTTTTTTTLSCVLHALPWVLAVVGALLFVAGLSWRNLSDSDTVNPGLVITGLLFTMLAGVLSCVTARAPERDYEPREPREPREPVGVAPERKEAQIPFVPI